jgi:hypothetical protein
LPSAASSLVAALTVTGCTDPVLIGSTANGDRGELRFMVPQQPLAVGALVRLGFEDGDTFEFEGWGSSQGPLRLDAIDDVRCDGCRELTERRHLDSSFAGIWVVPERPGPVEVEIRVRREDGEQRRDVFTYAARAVDRIELDCPRDSFTWSPAFCGGLAVFSGTSSQLQTRLLDDAGGALVGLPFATVDPAVLRAAAPFGSGRFVASTPGAATVSLRAGDVLERLQVTVATEADVVGVELALAHGTEASVDFVMQPYGRCTVDWFDSYTGTQCDVSLSGRPVLRLLLRDGSSVLGPASALSSNDPDVLQVEPDRTSSPERFVLRARRPGRVSLRAQIGGQSYILPMTVEGP